MQIGLRLKLFIMTISSMVIISGIILGLMILVTTDSTTKFQEELFQDKVTFLAEKYDDWYNHYKRMGESFTRNPVIKSTNLKEIQKWLTLELPALQDQDIYINNLIFVEKNGTGTYADGVTRNLNDIDIYAKVLQEGQFRVGSPYVSPSTGKPVVAFYFPVKGSDGDNRLISMTINLENILNLTTKYMTGSAYAFILDKDGTYIGHPNKDYILKTTLQNLAQENKSDELTAVSTHMLADETGFSVYNFFGVRRMLSYHPIPSLGWKIAVTDKYSAISGKVDSQVFSLIVIELAAMILVILVSIPFSLRMTHSVKKFSKELELVLGDSSVKGDLTKRIGVVSKDEMGQAANYFNHFLQDLREVLLITAEEVQRLDERGQELASNMVETASSILQINSNLSSIQHQMEKYYTHIDETNGVVLKISGAIDDSSQQVNVQNDAISQASSAVEEMVANLNSITSNVTNLGNLIQGLNGLSDTGRSRLGQMLESVKTVSDRSAALMNTNKIIDDIASKTNLLAMNAAIEAAHAGLSGRGFAVVADEIRKLAEQSSKQSKEVGVGLNAMTEAIGIIVDNSRVTERALDDILNSIKKVSTLEQEVRLSLTEQNEGSSQILESLERMRETTTQVSESTSQIQTQRDEITLRMKELKDLASGLEQGLNEISDGTREINLAVTEVDRLAQENKEGINKVSLSLGQVKLQ